MELCHHYIFGNTWIVEHEPAGGRIIFSLKDDNSKCIIQAWAGQDELPAFGRLLQVLEVFIHDGIFLKRGLVEKPVTERVDKVNVISHS